MGSLKASAIINDERLARCSFEQRHAIENIVCVGRITKCRPEYKIKWNNATINELNDSCIDTKDVSTQFGPENRDLIVEGMNEHHEKFGTSTAHPPYSNAIGARLTQQQTNILNNDNEGRYSVANLQMNVDERPSDDALQEGDDDSDGVFSEEEDDENYAEFTDATDHEAVTLVEPDYFSDNEDDALDPPTDTPDLNLSETPTNFHECVETERLDPVLTNPLSGE